ncbi:(2Fe-2S)-binding protein [Salibacterium salarium]|uniref:(2Fe-2S)-binding protein n=1 Tax=Salibacterium salarium TaxID=284579 RepID=A0A428N5J0_9BACI|nr:(2Fe-2S)-binding protein [Salibacterium salarium]RSL33549.1 (2Fe-2S)-binding protein [Salibacterium salarium]
MSNRIKNHPILGNLNDEYCTFFFDEKQVKARFGETIAAALLANNTRILRYHEASGSPRGIYCNIGHCFECRVNVNGQNGVRACMTVVKEGMDVHSQHSLPQPFQKGVWEENETK